MSDKLVYTVPGRKVELQFHEDSIEVVLNELVIARFDPSMLWDTTKRWMTNIKSIAPPILRRKLEAQIAHTASIHIANLITVIEEAHEEVAHNIALELSEE